MSLSCRPGAPPRSSARAVGALLVLAVCLPSAATAASLDAFDPLANDEGRFRLLRGFVALEARNFTAHRDRGLANEGALLEAEVELSLRLNRRVRAYARPRILIDLARTDLWRIEPYEAYITIGLSQGDVRLGQMVESWAIADTYNPIDLLNRRDLGIDLLDPPRLGEVGVRYRRFLPANRVFGEPTLSLYLIPVFRRARWAPEGLRLAPVVPGGRFDEDGGFDPRGNDRLFVAVRVESTWSSAWADADVQALVAHGPDRTPGLTEDTDAVLRPAYHGLSSIGFGARVVPNADVAGSVLASLTLKLELAYRHHFAFEDAPVAPPEDHVAFVVGADRTLYDVFRERDELALTVEIAGELASSGSARRARPFGSDLIFRLAWRRNDFARQSVELRGVVDLEQDESLLEISYARQLRKLHRALKMVASFQVADVPRGGSSFLARLPDNTHVSIVLRRDF